MVFSEQADEILSVGAWLGPEYSNWALSRKQALHAIESLRGVTFIILGGDVLNRADDNYKHAYANWSFNRSFSGANGDVTESARKATAYIEAYPVVDAYFVLVPGIV